ncbi:MAG: hypothetical protein WB676_17360 [Bryobacteraceae bacterium]
MNPYKIAENQWINLSQVVRIEYREHEFHLTLSDGSSAKIPKAELHDFATKIGIKAHFGSSPKRA